LKNYEIALQLYIEMHGTHHHVDIAMVYNEIGSVYDDMGNLDTALNYYEKGLEIHKDIEPNNDYGLVGFYANIANVYSKLGRYQEALSLTERVLETAIERDGELDFRVASLRHNIGVIYLHLGKPQAAYDYVEKALESRKEIFKSNLNNEDLGNSYQILGTCHTEVNRYSEALECYYKAQEIYRVAYSQADGENQIPMRELYSNISYAYACLNDLQEGIKYAIKAHTIALVIFDNNSLALAETYANLGVFHYNMDEYPQALYNLRNAITIYTKHYYPSHLNVESLVQIIKAIEAENRV